MPYLINRPLMGHQYDLEITKHEYDDLNYANEGLLRLLEIEEVWETALGNYRDYERGLTDVLVARLTDKRKEDRFGEDRVQMSRLLSNLLSSIRSFQELSHRAVNDYFGRSAMNEFKASLEALKGEHFSFRLMDELRNHSQHHSLPVTRLSYRNNLVGSVGEGVLEYRFSPQIIVDQMRKQKKWKEIIALWDTMQQQLPQPESAIDLTPHVRHYMHLESRVVVGLRERFSEVAAEWANKRWLARNRNSVPHEDCYSQIVVACHHDGKRMVDEFSLSSDIDELLALYRKNNGLLIGLMRGELRS